jgi:thiamine biosynthesis protein ThiS
MITVDSNDFEWHDGLTVAELLAELKSTGKYPTAVGVPGTIVALNGNIVPTDQYTICPVGRGDMIHLMSFMAGG